ncbi:WD40 repeat domain-containing protein [Ferrovibrio xuzhouensis]|uniref:WD40 repeat domain-containing protein n=1 Tax=Ferrovibrio xuzhouensis TaxID=1576914 RepID=A0ABV7VLJ0_9PROT
MKIAQILGEMMISIRTAGLLALLWASISPGILRAAEHESAGPEIVKVTFNHPQAADIAWSGDGRYLASAGLGSLTNWFGRQSVDPTVAIWDVRRKSLVGAYRRPGPFTYVSLIGPKPDVVSFDSTAAGWTREVSFSVWDARTGQLLRHVPGNTSAENPRAIQLNQPRVYSYNPATGLFAVARGTDGKVHIYDAEAWTEVDTLDVGMPPFSLEFSPDGRSLAVRQWHYVTIFDRISHKTVSRFRPYLGVTGGIAWGSDSKRIATIYFQAKLRSEGPAEEIPGGDAAIKIWDVESGKFLTGLSGDFDEAALVSSPISWSADGQYIAAVAQASGMRKFLLWKINGRRSPFTVDSDPKSVGPIRFSPATPTLASAGLDGLHVYEIH